MIAPMLAAAGWIAFVSPDFPQARSVFAEYEARMAPTLKARDLEVRFVPLPESAAPPVEATLERVLAQKPALVVAPAHLVAVHAKRMAAGSVPVIFATRTDPVRTGLAQSLAKPGGNTTGISYDVDINRKQLELLRRLAPRARVVGVLADDIWLYEEMGPARVARLERESGFELRVLAAESPEELVRLASMREGVPDAWLVPITNHSGRARNELVAALRGSRRPAMYGRSFFADAGGLASYQEVIPQPMRILADMSRAVLDGMPAGDIPVRRASTFEFVINLEAARDLGLAIPPSLLRAADRTVGNPPSP
jgi:putative ABC transport system substrate-binding protein